MSYYVKFNDILDALYSLYETGYFPAYYSEATSETLNGLPTIWVADPDRPRTNFDDYIKTLGPEDIADLFSGYPSFYRCEDECPLYKPDKWTTDCPADCRDNLIAWFEQEVE